MGSLSFHPGLMMKEERSEKDTLPVFGTTL
jgi:hypothetical protein